MTMKWNRCMLLPAGVGALLLAAHGEAPYLDVPGVVVDHLPAKEGVFVGSPSLAVLPDGNYVASHDCFGPGSTEHKKALTVLFRSPDRGRSWTRVSEIRGQFWSTLFVHRGFLYILGTDRHYGDVVIRRSGDAGITWTAPTNAACGLLRNNGQYHCAPVPVIEHGGRLWRGMERRDPPQAWGVTFRAGMMSVPSEADLLDAANWTFSNFLTGRTMWLGGTFGGWLEGNAVVSPAGELLDILRVDTSGYPEKAALVRVSGDGRMASFDPATGFVDLPGGAKKFTVRHDSRSGLYWSVTTPVPEKYRAAARPASVRNTLALISSPDLKNWTLHGILLQHPDQVKHGFQYVDWLFEDEDIIAVCRTAYDDGGGGARRAHDANYLTFHRISGFRTATRGVAECPAAR